MKQLKSEEELIGKTIERAVILNDNKYFLFFIDNSFCIFTDIGWEDNLVELSKVDFDTEPCIQNFDDLNDLGLIDTETYNHFKRMRSDMVVRDRKNQEIKLLNELRRKYPEE